MITSVSKRIHPLSGIIHIIINTEERWCTYQINRITVPHKITVSFFYDTETQPGCFDEYEEVEHIDMKEDFDALDYMVYQYEIKDQIALILIPRKMLTANIQWHKYE